MGGECRLFPLRECDFSLRFSEKHDQNSRPAAQFQYSESLHYFQLQGIQSCWLLFSSDYGDRANGIDTGTYPTPRTFTFGVRMNF